MISSDPQNNPIGTGGYSTLILKIKKQKSQKMWKTELGMEDLPDLLAHGFTFRDSAGGSTSVPPGGAFKNRFLGLTPALQNQAFLSHTHD